MKLEYTVLEKACSSFQQLDIPIVRSCKYFSTKSTNPERKRKKALTLGNWSILVLQRSCLISVSHNISRYFSQQRLVLLKWSISDQRFLLCILVGFRKKCAEQVKYNSTFFVYSLADKNSLS